MIRIYFSDFFEVPPESLYRHGAFNISLINDLPLFIDPFLIFNSQEPEIQNLHDEIIRYVVFLKDKSLLHNDIERGLLEAWFYFREVKQTWLGFSMTGNNGRGLGPDFAKKLYSNLRIFFNNFGDETISRGSHIERLYLIEDGVGKDNISDFATTLIKGFLAEYTQKFTQTYIDERFRKIVTIPKVRFNYETESWESRSYDMPFYQGDYVILTPRKLLTKDNLWIDKDDMVNVSLGYHEIAIAIADSQLRSQVNNYFRSKLPRTKSGKKPKKGELKAAVKSTFHQFPRLVEHYIWHKEGQGDSALQSSDKKVIQTEELFIEQIERFIELHLSKTRFYEQQSLSYQAAHSRILTLKNAVESNNAQWLFHIQRDPLSKEKDLKVLFKLIWLAKHELSDTSSSKEIIPEIKLAKNTQLRSTLEKIRDSSEKEHQTYLLKTLNKRLGLEEVKTFCFNLNDVEFENLGGEGKIGKIRELIRFFAMRHQLPYFVEVGSKFRPDIDWNYQPITPYLTAIVYFSEKEYQRLMSLLRGYHLRNNPNLILLDGRLN